MDSIAGGIVLFSILFWFPLARDLTKSISKMTRATGIDRGRPFRYSTRRFTPDELGRLGHAINRMAGRLKDFVTGQKRFLGDAAHELCSPLARMEIALGILEERSDHETLPYIRDVREEVTHMRKLANELLSFSKARSGKPTSSWNRSTWPRSWPPPSSGESRGRSDRVDVPEDISSMAILSCCSAPLANLVRNAVRYAGNAGPISWRPPRSRNASYITVADQGPGVSPPNLRSSLIPFIASIRRAPLRRAASASGSPSLRACVEACGGVVSATNRNPTGLEIRIRLNRAESKAQGAAVQGQSLKGP